MEKNILQKIFIEHYEEIKYILHPRDSVMNNIDKMINCYDPSFGGALYSCKLKYKTSLTDVPFVVTEAELLAELGWNLWDNERDVNEGLFSNRIAQQKTDYLK